MATTLIMPISMFPFLVSIKAQYSHEITALSVYLIFTTTTQPSKASFEYGKKCLSLRFLLKSTTRSFVLLSLSCIRYRTYVCIYPCAAFPPKICTQRFGSMRMYFVVVTLFWNNKTGSSLRHVLLVRLNTQVSIYFWYPLRFKEKYFAVNFTGKYGCLFISYNSAKYDTLRKFWYDFYVL